MTTEQDSKITPPTNNMVVFAPLGKYAIIAVIMVSIIVTTAIMLDKQLNMTENQFAIADTEFNTTPTQAKPATAQPQHIEKINANSVATAAVTNASVQKHRSAPEKQHVATNQVATNQVAANTGKNTPISPSASTNQTSKTVPAKTIAAIMPRTGSSNQASITPTPPVTAVSTSTPSTTSAPITTVNVVFTKPAQVEHRTSANATQQHLAEIVSTQHERIIAKNRAYLDSVKTKQKESMSIMFTRINTFEAMQLQNFKSEQQQQIASLRKQMAQQQQIINTLIARNIEILNIRKINLKRAQEQRQAILNHI